MDVSFIKHENSLVKCACIDSRYIPYSFNPNYPTFREIQDNYQKTLRYAAEKHALQQQTLLIALYPMPYM